MKNAPKMSKNPLSKGDLKGAAKGGPKIGSTMAGMAPSKAVAAPKGPKPKAC